jgi:hypothetical protein
LARRADAHTSFVYLLANYENFDAKILVAL